MLWKVKNKEVYLFGGVHVLKPNTNPFIDQLGKIYLSVKQVVIEANIGEQDFDPNR